VNRRLATARRIVVKIGSSLLVHDDAGTLRRAWLETLAADVARLRARGQDVVIVSSGAIALGRRNLRITERTLRLEVSQAAAAVGQIRLAHAYQEILAPHGIVTAQVLLTSADTEARRRYLNARGTLSTLLSLGAVPVINENDTVATDEIRFGDNDRLAARVAEMVSADCLVLLSDVAGLHTADPRRDPGATLIAEVSEITPAIAALAGDAASADSRGGMVTKIAAARIAVGAGCHTVIADGTVSNPLSTLEQGAPSTWFVAQANPRTARKLWIAGSLRPVGRVTVDDGALKALAGGKSLLPAGVRAVDGDFQRGDAVTVCAADGREIGRGLSAYSAADARRIMGHKSREIEQVLGYRGRDEMIHRDDLALNRNLASTQEDPSA
jgi:glutamate 5-kinase